MSNSTNEDIKEESSNETLKSNYFQSNSIFLMFFSLLAFISSFLVLFSPTIFWILAIIFFSLMKFYYCVIFVYYLFTNKEKYSNFDLGVQNFSQIVIVLLLVLMIDYLLLLDAITPIYMSEIFHFILYYFLEPSIFLISGILVTAILRAEKNKIKFISLLLISIIEPIRKIIFGLLFLRFTHIGNDNQVAIISVTNFLIPALFFIWIALDLRKYRIIYNYLMY